MIPIRIEMSVIEAEHLLMLMGKDIYEKIKGRLSA